MFAVDDAHDVQRPKFVYIGWVGSSVGGLKKGRAGMDNKEFQPVFDGSHLSLQASDLESISKEAIEERLQQNQGSHKPSGYVW